LQKTADDLLDPEAPGDWNQTMMELGATLCTPKSPQCLICPVAQFCEARKQGLAEILPEKRRKRASVEVTLAAAVFASENGKTLLLPPPETSNSESLAEHIPTLVSKLWHFPTISVNGEAAGQLLEHMRKLNPEFSKRKFHFHAAGKVRHAVTYRDITVFPFLISVKRLPRVIGAREVPLEDISIVPVSNLTRKVARAALAAEKSR
jgi:adenine-specific DNA glycosylase